jgi:hypothetical protein
VLSSAPPIPTLISPLNNALMDNNCQGNTEAIQWNFSWTSVTGATKYQIYVIHTGAANPVIDEIVSTTSYYFGPSGWIPNENLSGWTWRVRAGNDSNVWSNWSTERSFVVEPLNTDCLGYLLSGTWLYTNYLGNTFNVSIESRDTNRCYILAGGNGFVHAGLYEVRNNYLVKIESPNPNYPNATWQIINSNYLYLTDTGYAGSTLTR